jgi:hypothetical protein
MEALSIYLLGLTTIWLVINRTPTAVTLTLLIVLVVRTCKNIRSICLDKLVPLVHIN